MTGVLVLFGGLLVILAIIALLDWLTRRKDRRSENRPAV
jgi:flagellar biogenesis protein FliO